MYDNLKQFMKNLNEKTNGQIVSLVDGKTSYMELIVRTRRLQQAKLSLDKHLKKKAHTEKWQRRMTEHQDKVTNEIAQLLAYMNIAHSFQLAFFKLIYRAETLKNGGAILNTYELPTNYMDILADMKFLDSTDRERYILFNRLRNILFHSTLNRLISYIDKDISLNMQELFESLHTCNSVIFASKNEYANKIISYDFEQREDSKLWK